MADEYMAYESFEVSAEDVSSIAGLRPRIDGNHTYQSTLLPISMLNGADSDEQPPLGNRFRLLVIEGGKNGCRLFADLSCGTDLYVVGTTVVLNIVFDCSEDVQLRKDQAEALAKWAAHVAYDFAALSLRQLSANNPVIKDVDLPIQPFVSTIDTYLQESAEDSS